jgi:tRNA 2-thiouridine synthesizing protein A
VAPWRSGSRAGNGVRQRRAEIKPSPEASTVDFDKELDARGLSCPLPILKTKKSLNELTSGQVLKVVATDPGSIKDMQAFATQTGNPLLSTTEENKTYVFYLKKK